MVLVIDVRAGADVGAGVALLVTLVGGAGKVAGWLCSAVGELLGRAPWVSRRRRVAWVAASVERSEGRRRRRRRRRRKRRRRRRKIGRRI